MTWRPRLDGSKRSLRYHRRPTRDGLRRDLPLLHRARGRGAEAVDARVRRASPARRGQSRPGSRPVPLACRRVDVPLDRYGPGPLEVSLRDMRVGRRRRRRPRGGRRAFRAAGEDATVIPMKLFTMFSTTGAGRRRDALPPPRSRSRVLKRIAGCEEWGVRITQGGPPCPPQGRTERARRARPFSRRRKQARDDARDARAGGGARWQTARSRRSRRSRAIARRRDDAPEGAVAAAARRRVPGAGRPPRRFQIG